MNTRTKEGLSQIVIYLLLFTLANVVIFGFIYNNIDEFRKYFLASMTEDKMSYPSIFEVVFSVLTFGAIAWAAWAYSGQADAQLKHATIAENQEIDKRFADALDQFDVGYKPYKWYAAVETMLHVAKLRPEKYFEATVTTLRLVGEEYSHKLKKHHDPRNPTISQIEGTRFLFFVLETLIEIKNHKNFDVFYNRQIEVEGFYIECPKSLYQFDLMNNFLITNKSLEYFKFFRCSLGMVEFEQCNFNNSTFIDSENVSLSDCLIPNINNQQLAQTPNYQELRYDDEAAFRHLGRCRIWDTDDSQHTINILNDLPVGRVLGIHLLPKTKLKEWLHLPNGSRLFETWGHLHKSK